MPKFATLDKEPTLSAKLKVIGVGGGGCNAIESMMSRGLSESQAKKQIIEGFFESTLKNIKHNVITKKLKKEINKKIN